MPDIFVGELDLDLNPPYVVNEFPSPGSSGISIESSIGFDIFDYSVTEAGVDPNSITVKINDGSGYVSAAIDGVFQTGFSGGIIPLSTGAYHVVVDPSDYFIEGTIYTISVDAQDLAGIPNVMTTHTWTFTTSLQFLKNSKCFMVNTQIDAVSDVSSRFKPEINTVSAGSDGNISLNVDTLPNVTQPGTTGFEVRTMRSGRLDTKLNTQLLRELDLGTGQITYTDETAVKGSFRPPGYVVDDGGAGGSVFGMDKTFTKHIYSSDNNGDKIIKSIICDRNDESFFVFLQRNSYPIAGYEPRCTSIPKVGKTDSNPKTNVLISMKSVDDAIKISDDRYLIITTDYISGSHAGSPEIYFTIVDDDLNVVFESGAINFLSYLEGGFSPTSVYTGYNGASLYTDGSGTVYCVVSYTNYYHSSVPSSLNNRKLYFMKSTDGGYNWELVKSPGTNEPLTVDNPLTTEVGLLEPQTNIYWQQTNPKLFYDDINEIFILTYKSFLAGGANTQGRFVSIFSKDFVNWSRYNYPIFYEPIANKSSADFIENTDSIPSRVVRFGEQFVALNSTKYGIYQSIFEYDNDVFGLRGGMFWGGDETTSQKGAYCSSMEYKELDNILYLVTGCYIQQGYTVHAIGVPSNIPDQSPYIAAWFGNHSTPDDDYGYALTETGTPTKTSLASGLSMGIDTSDTLVYDYGNFNATSIRSDGLKFKAILKQDSSSHSSSDADAQKIYVKVPTFGDTAHFDFYVSIGDDGVRVINTTTPSENIYLTQSFTDFAELIVCCVPQADDTTMKIRLFVKTYDDGDLEDRWTYSDVETFSLTAGVLAPYLGFGLSSAPSALSDYIWKAVYLGFNPPTPHADLVHSINDGMTEYISGSNDEMLVPLSMLPETFEQESINDFTFKWRGLDAYVDDKWNFSVESDFYKSNLVNKYPSIPYRSAVTSADIYFDLSADSSGLDIGMMIFDTMVFLNTNFRYVNVLANDTASWGSPTFSKTIDMTLDTGTIAADSTRQDEDKLVVRCTDKEWLHGELVDKYIMLEKIYEQHNVTSPGLDNNYKNVAFKIIDNGPDYVVISTKGLLKDELDTDPGVHDYADMKVISGDNFLIYDTRLASITDEPQAFVYIRVVIPMSASYSDVWGSNQPSLPNERSWQIGEFDIGQRIVLKDNVSYPYTEDIDLDIKLKNNEDGQINVDRNGVEFRVFNLDYKLIDDDDHDALESLYNSASEYGQPFWYVPSIVDSPEKVYLVFLSKELNKSKMLPDHQSDRMTLEEVT